MHSKDYVLKIIDELDYTLEEVMFQVMEYTESIVTGLHAVAFLRQYKAKDIRKILQHNKQKIKKRKEKIK